MKKYSAEETIKRSELEEREAKEKHESEFVQSVLRMLESADIILYFGRMHFSEQKKIILQLSKLFSIDDIVRLLNKMTNSERQQLWNALRKGNGFADFSFRDQIRYYAIGRGLNPDNKFITAFLDDIEGDIPLVERLEALKQACHKAGLEAQVASMEELIASCTKHEKFLDKTSESVRNDRTVDESSLEEYASLLSKISRSLVNIAQGLTFEIAEPMQSLALVLAERIRLISPNILVDHLDAPALAWPAMFILWAVRGGSNEESVLLMLLYRTVQKELDALNKQFPIAERQEAKPTTKVRNKKYKGRQQK